MLRSVIVILCVGSTCACGPSVADLEDVRIEVQHGEALPEGALEPAPSPYTLPPLARPNLAVQVFSHADTKSTLSTRCPDLSGLEVEVDGRPLPFQAQTAYVVGGDVVDMSYRCVGSFVISGPEATVEDGRIVIADAAGDHPFEVPSLRQPLGLALAAIEPGTDRYGAFSRIRFRLEPWAAALAAPGTRVSVRDGPAVDAERSYYTAPQFHGEGFDLVVYQPGKVWVEVRMTIAGEDCEGAPVPCGSARYGGGTFEVELP